MTGNLVCFCVSVDASMAGPGGITVCVKGKQSRPHVELSADSRNVYSASFVPTEGVVHSVTVKFNDCDVNGVQHNVESFIINYYTTQ